MFDLNDDSLVDAADRVVWIADVKQTYVGDANLDGEFNSSDFIFALASGEYEDGVEANSGWSTGDWNGNAEFDSSDLVNALQAGGYEAGPRAATRSVPEPAVAMLLSCGALPLAIGFHQRRSKSAPSLK
jgi:hypothetical protein